jgi:hypothetical protein
MYIEKLRDVFPPIQIIMEICKQITIPKLSVTIANTRADSNQSSPAHEYCRYVHHLSPVHVRHIPNPNKPKRRPASLGLDHLLHVHVA